MPITAEAKLAFEDLFTRFKVADEILKWVISDTGLGCSSLVDFSSAINDGNIDVVVNESKVLGDGPKLLQGGRIRQVLKSLREAEEDAAKLKMRGQNETDLDVLLPQVELDGLDAHFWARYKVRYPAWVRPSDLLISRLSREIGKRLLSIHDIWKTRSLLHQKKSKQKKQKVGDVEITTGEPEDPEHVSRDVGTYLNLLFTLMLAFAMAGAEPHPHPPVEPEVKGSSTVKYVLVPLDIVCNYLFRIQEKLTKVPHAQQLEWLTTRDEGERAMWVDRYRDSGKTLGAVIEEVFHMREAMWEYGEPSTPTKALPPPKQVPPPPPQPPRKGKGGSKGSGGQGGGGKKIKLIKYYLKDNTKLCPDWQKGSCKNNMWNCSKGKHMCGAVEVGGRVCGGRHTPSRCTNKRVERV